MKAKSDPTEIFVKEVSQGAMDFCIVGQAPLICNRMSEKAKHELLMPKGRKNAAEKASTLKHSPLAEFRESPYTSRGDDSETRLQVLGVMFKCAMRTAAMDTPGSSKQQIGRLLYVEQERVSLFGIPQLLMSVTRCKDMNRTPDVRTRMIVPHWACRITVRYVQPMVRTQSVANLLAAGGFTSGIGDWRVEKGSGAFGRYRVCDENDEEYLHILATGGRAAQDDAIANPIAYDDETDSLLSWYETEFTKRGFGQTSTDATVGTKQRRTKEVPALPSAQWL